VAEETVPFIRSQRYIDKKLAPEKGSKMSVQALANQARIAVETGMLPRAVADMMLPNLIIEGRFGDYGVNQIDLKELSPHVRKTLGIDAELAAGRMGLYTDTSFKGRPQVIPSKTGNYIDGTTGNSEAQQNANAKLAVAALTKKQATAKRLYGDDATAEQVIQLWNGTGPDSRRHISRVVEAAGLLTHGSNKQIKGIWDMIMSPASGGSSNTLAPAPAPSSEFDSTMQDSQNESE